MQHPADGAARKPLMHLGLDVSYIHMGGRWRDPAALAGRRFPDVELYEDIARLAERGLLDMIFSGDGTGVPDTYGGSRDAAVEWGINWPHPQLSPHFFHLESMVCMSLQAVISWAGTVGSCDYAPYAAVSKSW